MHENNEDLAEATSEQEEQENGQASPDEQARPNESEDSSYRPLFEDEEPLEKERFKRQLIATARSLKKKQQQLQGDQDLLVDRWTDVLADEEYSLRHPAKSYSKRRLLPQFDEEAPEPIPPPGNAADRPLRGRDSAVDRPPRSRDRAATKAEQHPMD